MNGRRSRTDVDDDDDNVGVVDCFPGICYDRCDSSHLFQSLPETMEMFLLRIKYRGFFFSELNSVVTSKIQTTVRNG